ncbi:hypothetical protein VTN49DRAFT_5658 [Thermomyces lanuginosus]|uniref:uncharacterized protein n=1 Tax=Thermomyces lanuginosus TaxID=5541 RepID=UPI003742305F
MAAAAPQQQQDQPTILTAQQQQQFDLGITLALNAWPALSLAVASNWGGPESGDKRDWLCGAVSDMFTERPETDAEDLEEVLIQVMNDEFDVVVDDGSAAEVARQIMDLREQCARDEFGTVQSLWAAYQEKMAKKGAGAEKAMFKRVENEEDDDDDDDEDDDGEDDDGDIEMGDAPAPVRVPREKPEPEVDEEGFTKVVGRRKR